MLYDNATRKYIAAQHTINKTSQIVLLYDGILKFINQAIDSIDKNDVQERFNNIEKATAIITGLQTSLDFENGGEIAKLLDDYYFSIYMRLMSVHANNDKTICEHVIKELFMMRDAWNEVNDTISQAQATGPVTDDVASLQVSI